jgi:hypothetical protein
VLRNFEGRVFRYPDPGGTAGAGRAVPAELLRAAGVAAGEHVGVQQ